LLKEELEQRLGVGLQPVQAAGELMSQAARIRRSDGWHVRWGLPRPSYIGLQAGSCLVFQVTSGSLDPARLRAVELAGLGERRAEGYGEVALNHPLLASKLSTLAVAGSPHTKRTGSQSEKPTPISKNGAVYNYARSLERAAWRDSIARLAEKLGFDPDWRKRQLKWDDSSDKPPNSQLGALRSALARLRSGDKQFVLQWLNHLANTESRREKWPNGAIETLRDLISDQDTVWKWLRELEDDAFPTMTEGAEAELRAELWGEAVTAVLLAAMRGAAISRE
jgi:CRISPR-associated protein Csx10